ncbi:outer membrane protein assembly factor BamB [Teredinibacter purpureus]|jgi:outer membrane assembly lipoprotein YfgL|uniref:outer membrane protein assembly factor BamB n=1 Tax=Teredinibacter purpureus TaxID=2731756 RepID=UPI0005F81CFC|nr:outer membrane protein assembly factor BamB [Teredinibacter purpureus]
MLRFLLLLVTVAGLVACGSKDAKEIDLEAVDLIDFEKTIEMDKLWSRSGGSGQDKPFSRFTPALDGKGNIYTVGYKGDVNAFAVATGKKIWSVDTKQRISGGAGANNNSVFFGTFDGTVHVLDSETGQQRWEASVSSEIASAPASNGEIVVANTIDGRVFAFAAETGELLWSYDHTLPVLTLRGTASPVLTSSQVIVAFDNGQILSLSASDGSTQWQFRVSRPKGRTELDRIVDIDGTPVVDGGYLYAGSYQGNVAGVSRGPGRVMWTKEASTNHSVAVYGGKVFVSTEESRIMALNGITGELEWENFELKRRNTSAPVVFDDYVAVVDGFGYVHVLSQADGAFADRFKLAGGGSRSRTDVRAPLHSDGTYLFTYANSGKLSAYTVKDAD